MPREPGFSTGCYGSLTLLGSKLYGVTQNGGSSGKGVLFSVNTDGSGFTVQNSFGLLSSDGINPRGDLTLSTDASTLYGMTPYGGILGDAAWSSPLPLSPSPRASACWAWEASCWPPAGAARRTADAPRRERRKNAARDFRRLLRGGCLITTVFRRCSLALLARPPACP